MHKSRCRDLSQPVVVELNGKFLYLLDFLVEVRCGLGLHGQDIGQGGEGDSTPVITASVFVVGRNRKAANQSQCLGKKYE